MSKSPVPKKRSWLPWIALAAVAYVLSPVDLLPDLVPGIGWADDIFVTIAAFVTGAWQRKKEMEQEQQAPVASAGPAQAQTVEIQPFG